MLLQVHVYTCTWPDFGSLSSAGPEVAHPGGRGDNTSSQSQAITVGDQG